MTIWKLNCVLEYLAMALPDSSSESKTSVVAEIQNSNMNIKGPSNRILLHKISVYKIKARAQIN